MDEEFNQTLLRRKMYELFGENIPQFILQLSIKLENPNITLKMMFDIIFNIPSNAFSPAIATSLLGIILINSKD